jgi:hypothetical protein
MYKLKGSWIVEWISNGITHAKCFHYELAAQQFFGAVATGWGEMIDVVSRRDINVKDQVGAFDKLFDVVSQIVDIEEKLKGVQERSESVLWSTISTFMGGDFEAQKKELKKQLDALEVERKRIIQDIANKRKSEIDKGKPKDEIKPKVVKDSEDAEKVTESIVDKAIATRKAAKVKELSDTRQQVLAEGEIWSAHYQKIAAERAGNVEAIKAAAAKEKVAVICTSTSTREAGV